MNDLLVKSAKALRESLEGLSFSFPVAHVYQPLDYAWESHCAYLRQFGQGQKKVLFLGMNPGPYGMTQTGVPFGEIAAVRDWMGITSPVLSPRIVHPKRPIEGFSCTRSEVSGRRLWGLFASRYSDPNDFFHDHFVANYCPLVWMSESGANITPDKISAREMQPVETACQRHLQEVIEILQPKFLILLAPPFQMVKDSRIQAGMAKATFDEFYQNFSAASCQQGPLRIFSVHHSDGHIIVAHLSIENS